MCQLLFLLQRQNTRQKQRTGAHSSEHTASPSGEAGLGEFVAIVSVEGQTGRRELQWKRVGSSSYVSPLLHSDPSPVHCLLVQRFHTLPKQYPWLGTWGSNSSLSGTVGV